MTSPPSHGSTANAPAPGLDRLRPGATQDEPALAHRSSGPRLRVRTLVTFRWLVVAGELMILTVVGLGLGLQAPYPLCLGLIAVGAWTNFLTSIASPAQRQCGDREAAAHLAFDVLQISGLVYLTGGAANPFMLMLIAPVTLGAATLPERYVAGLAALAAGAAVLLAFFSLALPSLEGAGLDPPLVYRLAASCATVAGIVLIAGYVRQAAAESARMALALDVTQVVLAREQRLSALGALAAAAAHELGTPLATIAIVAKEMGREAPTPGVKEDSELLIAQAERCREILRRLTETPEATDEVHERMSLRQLLQEVIEPHAQIKGVRVEAIVVGPPRMPAPDVWRLPEVQHAFTSFVENAVDFARSEVLVTARFDESTVSIEVRDDGPGFASEVLSKLGEPYVTTRPGAEGSRTGHIGMGLGFFISKTLLERTGATVGFQNARPHGAVVSARWSRSKIAAGEM